MKESLAGKVAQDAGRQALDLGVEADGLWCSFAAAYFPDLPAALASWTRSLRPGGWAALTEIDDMFGHEPLGARPRSHPGHRSTAKVYCCIAILSIP